MTQRQYSTDLYQGQPETQSSDCEHAKEAPTVSTLAKKYTNHNGAQRLPARI